MKKRKGFIGICSFCKNPIYKGQHNLLFTSPLTFKFSNKKINFLVHTKKCLKKQLVLLFKEIEEELKAYERFNNQLLKK